MLLTCLNGVMRAYWYEEGYIRTSCEEFSIKDCGNQYIHLTNDAIQKYADDYGKYETGNKLSFLEF
jgi:tubulin polyglutamylase TTLL1/tubulin monoglycylase TTLL3/8